MDEVTPELFELAKKRVEKKKKSFKRQLKSRSSKTTNLWSNPTPTKYGLC